MLPDLNYWIYTSSFLAFDCVLILAEVIWQKSCLYNVGETNSGVNPTKLTFLLIFNSCCKAWVFVKYENNWIFHELVKFYRKNRKIMRKWVKKFGRIVSRGRIFSQAENKLVPRYEQGSLLVFPYNSRLAGNELVSSLTKNTASDLNKLIHISGWIWASLLLRLRKNFCRLSTSQQQRKDQQF